MTRDLAIDAAGRLTHRAVLDDGRVAALLGLLDRDGEEARVVGGAVRNALLGLPPGDIDIATTALPPAVTERAKAARLFAPQTRALFSGATLFNLDFRAFFAAIWSRLTPDTFCFLDPPYDTEYSAYDNFAFTKQTHIFL